MVSAKMLASSTAETHPRPAKLMDLNFNMHQFDNQNYVSYDNTQVPGTLSMGTAMSLFPDENSYLKYEVQRLQERNLQLDNEIIMWKDQVDDLTKSDENHLKTIAETESTLHDERGNYRQLLQTMVRTAEESAELVVELDEVREENKDRVTRLEQEKKALEEELDDIKSKLAKIGTDFEQLQKLFDQQEASIIHFRSINKQFKSKYTKYKLECRKLTKELKIINTEDSPIGTSSPTTLSLLEQVSSSRLADIVKKLAEEEIDQWFADASSLGKFHSGELRKLENENKVLRERLFFQEKQCAGILQEAKSRILSQNDTFKILQTEISFYKERILNLDRRNKADILKTDEEMKKHLKKQSMLEAEKTHLTNNLERANHRIEILTQRVNTLQQLPLLKQDNEDMNENSCNREEMSIMKEYQSLTQTTVTNTLSNAVNHSVLRTVSVTSTSDTTEIHNNELKESPKESSSTSSPLPLIPPLFPLPLIPPLFTNASGAAFAKSENGKDKLVANAQNLQAPKWVNEEDTELVASAQDGNVFSFNARSSANDLNCAFQVQDRNANRFTRYSGTSFFRCNYCNVQCATAKNLKKHVEKVHAWMKGGIVVKTNNSHRIIKNFNSMRTFKRIFLCPSCQRSFSTENEKMHHFC